MTDEETERLVAELEALPDYQGWWFAYEYPGYFCYRHPNLPFRVAFTPDWSEDGMVDVQVDDHVGTFYEEHSCDLPFPQGARTGQALLDLVRPTLDKLATCTASVEHDVPESAP